jgi:hypothetical protein
MFLEFIVRVTRQLSKFRRGQYRIAIELAWLGVLGIHIVLDKKAILLIEPKEPARIALRAAELSARLAHVLQSTENLKTIASIAVADLEPRRPLVEGLAEAVPVFLVLLLELGARDDVRVVDLGAQLLDVGGIGDGAISDAEFGHVSSRPATLYWLRPLREWVPRFTVVAAWDLSVRVAAVEVWPVT